MFTLDELHEKAERIESGEVVERAYSTPQLAGQKFWSLRVRDSAEGNTSVKWLIHGEAKPAPHIGGEADSLRSLGRGNGVLRLYGLLASMFDNRSRTISFVFCALIVRNKP